MNSKPISAVLKRPLSLALIIGGFLFPQISQAQCNEVYSSGNAPLVCNPINKPSKLKNGYTLVFEDEFNGSLNNDVWRVGDNQCYGDGDKIPAVKLTAFSNNGHTSFPLSDPRRQQTTVNVVSSMDASNTTGESYLELLTIEKPTNVNLAGYCNPNSSLISGLVETKEDYLNFKHGYFETRVQIPSEPGLWPAFWLYHNLDFGVAAEQEPIVRDGGEIDIFEIWTEEVGSFSAFSPSNYHFHIPGAVPNAGTYVTYDGQGPLDAESSYTRAPYNFSYTYGDGPVANNSNCNTGTYPLDHLGFYNCILSAFQYGAQGKTYIGYSAIPQSPKNDWFVFGLEWTTDRMEFYVNGVLVRRVRDCNVPDILSKIILNVGGAAANSNRINGRNLQNYPQSMKVDYVRVWKRIEVEDFGAAASAGAWNKNDHRRLLGDVNGDGGADIVGFGGSQVFVSMGFEDWESGASFRYPTPQFKDFCIAQGWEQPDHTIELADVTGDGKDDIVGFGPDGVRISISYSDDFDAQFYTPTNAYSGHFANNASTQRPYNSVDHIRTTGDINDDGLEDLVGFWDDGVYFALAKPGLPRSYTFMFDDKALNYFGLNQGWSVANHIRMLEDIDGDGDDDIIGFRNQEISVAHANPIPMIPLLDNADNDPGIATQNQSIRQTNFNTLLSVRNTSPAGSTILFYPLIPLRNMMNQILDAGYAVPLFPNFHPPVSGGINPVNNWEKKFHPIAIADVDQVMGANMKLPKDIIIYGPTQIHVAQGTGNQSTPFSSFGAPLFINQTLDMPVDAYTQSQNWDNIKHVRLLADYTGDGKADLIGFHDKWVYGSESISDINGIRFKAPEPLYQDFSFNQQNGHEATGFQGFNGIDHIRTVADVNADEAVDFIGFGDKGVYLNVSAFGCDNLAISGEYDPYQKCWITGRYANNGEPWEKTDMDSKLENSIEKSIRVSPNPNSGYFTIDMPFQEAQASLLNINGQEVWRGTLTRGQHYDFNLENGIYMVRVQHEAQFFHAKIVIRR